MPYTSKIGAEAIRQVTAYLKMQPQTLGVQSVEKDESYRTQGIDLLWHYRGENGAYIESSIEVKGDRVFAQGNYFFETMSNEERKTEGWFLYSKADFLYYYFLKKELHIIPLPRARAWFVAHIETFPEKKSATATAAYSTEVRYHTAGRLVKHTQLIKAVEGVSIIPYNAAWDKDQPAQ